MFLIMVLFLIWSNFCSPFLFCFYRSIDRVADNKLFI